MPDTLTARERPDILTAREGKDFVLPERVFTRTVGFIITATATATATAATATATATATTNVPKTTQEAPRKRFIEELLSAQIYDLLLRQKEASDFENYAFESYPNDGKDVFVRDMSQFFNANLGLTRSFVADDCLSIIYGQQKNYVSIQKFSDGLDFSNTRKVITKTQNFLLKRYKEATKIQQQKPARADANTEEASEEKSPTNSFVERYAASPSPADSSTPFFATESMRLPSPMTSGDSRNDSGSIPVPTGEGSSNSSTKPLPAPASGKSKKIAVHTTFGTIARKIYTDLRGGRPVKGENGYINFIRKQEAFVEGITPFLKENQDKLEAIGIPNFKAYPGINSIPSIPTKEIVSKVKNALIKTGRFTDVEKQPTSHVEANRNASGHNR